MLELKDISVIFKKGKRITKAVLNFNLKVKKGEIVVLVGESGSGKTTLGKVASLLIKPTKGEVIFHKKDVWSLGKKEFKKIRPKIQIVHQDPYAALNPTRSVYSILATGIKLYRSFYPGNVKDHVVELLEKVGIIPPDYFLDKYPHHLSGGMKQRLCFARAIIPKPELIVADEVISMIDPSFKVLILDLMKKLNEEGIAFLYITHELPSAKYLAPHSNMIVMYSGRCLEVGKVSDILDNPYHPYTRMLLSFAPSIGQKPKSKERKSFLAKAIASSEATPEEGCIFYPRCIWADESCAKRVPELMQFNKRLVACHKVDKILKL